MEKIIGDNKEIMQRVKWQFQRGKVRNFLQTHIFILPSVLGVLLFYLVPLVFIVLSSFQRGGSFSFESYQIVWKNVAFWLATKNTLLFMLIAIPLLMTLSLAFARFLSKSIGAFDRLKIVYILPLALPAVSMSLFWRFFFAPRGLLNGFLHVKIDWLDTALSFLVVIFLFIWKNFGYMMILWLAGIMSVSQSMIEAARIDGASERTIFLRIILPTIQPTAVVVYLLSLIQSFRVFRDIYALAGDYPHEQMYLWQHLFNNWFRDFELDKMTAGTCVYLLILLIALFPIAKGMRREK
ncbi:multiple sugar transport system permease protein [Pilibacter termitis]|uniref:Multiple sugar transport system permease protein n=1 Tax=Pilibacter termitis TaxID=263852 RepID=A0A1T4QXG2_9ENTE|nr:sugar ABC transporter permease [Pilibacter termitis]SKA08404.1 multiple sugar transport system permease protein [Pilibacter termitis]